MKQLFLPLLVGFFFAPSAASAYSESFGYEAGYKACIREHFEVITKKYWDTLSRAEKDAFRARGHVRCK